ncbi:MAG: zinc ribbon domain-containing protein [Dehalococcoidia bacterium]|nr:zinc ribbon domain-containing protein [Dehalococcoidia bacterium]
MVSVKNGKEVDWVTGSSPDSRAELATGGPKFCARCGNGLVGHENFCKACGMKVAEATESPASSAATAVIGKRFCNTCGAGVHPLAEICPKCGVRLAKLSTSDRGDASTKSRLTATLLCALLGGLLLLFGIHRLYLGKIGTGVTLLLLGIAGWLAWWFYGLGFLFWAIGGIWQLVDFILLLSGSMKDGQGKTVKTWTNGG